MSPVDPYPPPVDTLLTYGVCKNFHTWPDYVSELGLGPEHVSDLIRMATDPALNRAHGDSLEVWAPTHAWRSLGQLKAEEAIEPLMVLFDDLDGEGDDWVLNELPRVYGMIGPAAIPVLSAYLSDRAYGKSSRITVSVALGCIVERYTEVRSECVAVLTRQLERFDENDTRLNAFLISLLTDLKAEKSAPVIERAFAADRVDKLVMGDWEDAQVELGLKPFREKPRPPLFDDWKRKLAERVSRDSATGKEGVELLSRDNATREERTARHKVKANRKQAKKSRKANRNKKKKKK